MSKGKKKSSVRRSPAKEAEARQEAAQKAAAKAAKRKPAKPSEPGRASLAMGGVKDAFGRLMGSAAERAEARREQSAARASARAESRPPAGDESVASEAGAVVAPVAPDPVSLYRPSRGDLREWRSKLRDDARGWIANRGFELWLLVGIWAVASLVVFWLATGHESPRRYQDEFLFWGVAKAFAAGDGITWRGVDIGLRSPLYPVLLAPAFWVGGSVPSIYTLVHLLDALMMCAVVFPAYLMARFFMDRTKALIAAAFALAVPAMNYAGIIGTESLAYPVAVATFGAIIHAIVIPRPRSWLIALGAILLAMLTRTQFVVFLPIFVGAMILAGLMRERGTRRDYFRLQLPVLAASAAVLVIAVLVFLFRGKEAVGLYAGVFEGVSPSFGDIWFWLKAFAADVFILSGFLPAIAVVALAFEGDKRRNPMTGALIATAFVGAIAFVAEVTWFSATNPYDWRGRHIFYERYMFYLGPLFFTGLLLAWRQVSMRAAICATVIGAFILAGFQKDAVLVPFSYDSFALTTAGQLMDGNPGLTDNIGLALAGVGAVLGAILVMSTVQKSTLARYAAWLVLAAPFTILFWGQAQTWYYARLYSHDSFAGFPKPADFIDQATDNEVAMFVTSTDSPEMYFTTEFWNSKITRAFASAAAPFQTPVMYSPKCDFDWAPDGQILAPTCDVVPTSFYLRSKDVSVHLRDETKRAHPQAGLPDLTLMEAPEARMLSILTGRNVVTGAAQGTFTAQTFLGQPGQIRVSIEAPTRDLEIKIGTSTAFVRAGQDAQVVAKLPANDTSTKITANSGGVVQEVVVPDVEVREGNGEWTSIS